MNNNTPKHEKTQHQLNKKLNTVKKSVGDIGYAVKQSIVNGSPCRLVIVKVAR